MVFEMTQKLDAEQKDILRELMNVYVGQAAGLLSEITNRRIHLSVPSVELLSLKEKDKYSDNDFCPEISKGSVLSSSLKFGDNFTGKAELIFPADKVKQLAIIVEGEEWMDDYHNAEEFELTDMDFDLMKEIGNIILNSVIGGIGNQLQEPLSYQVLEVEVFEKLNLAQKYKKIEDGYLLLLSVSFNIDDTEIVGAIMVNFTLQSVEFLIEEINRIKDELDE